MATTVRVQVYERGIQALFEPTGDVGSHVRHIGGQAANESKALLVPGFGFRTGNLQRSIRANGGIMARFSYKVTVRAAAEHAMWVNEGVVGPITATGPLGLLAVGRREGKKPIWRASVAGQPAQKFLQRGMSSALISHGYSPIE